MTFAEAALEALKLIGVTIFGLGGVVVVVLYIAYLIEKINNKTVKAFTSVTAALFLIFIAMTLLIYYAEGG